MSARPRTLRAACGPQWESASSCLRTGDLFKNMPRLLHRGPRWASRGTCGFGGSVPTTTVGGEGDYKRLGGLMSLVWGLLWLCKLTLLLLVNWKVNESRSRHKGGKRGQTLTVTGSWWRVRQGLERGRHPVRRLRWEWSARQVGSTRRSSLSASVLHWLFLCDHGKVNN